MGGQTSQKKRVQGTAGPRLNGTNMDLFKMASILDALDNTQVSENVTNFGTSGNGIGANNGHFPSTTNGLARNGGSLDTIPPSLMGHDTPLDRTHPPPFSSSPHHLMHECRHANGFYEERLCPGHKQVCPTQKENNLVNSPCEPHSSNHTSMMPKTNLFRPLSDEPVLTIEESEMESCTNHPEEKLAYFCIICYNLKCRVCVSTEHAHHDCIKLQESYSHLKPGIKDLLRKTRVELNLLQCSLCDVQKMNARVSEKQQEAIDSVRQIFHYHREAVTAQENKVISQINDIASKRTSSINSEEKKIMAAVDSLWLLSQAGDEIVQDRNKSKMLMCHHQLSKELDRCHCYMNSLLSPIEDDSFILKSNLAGTQSSLRNLCTLTTPPYPSLCSAMGDGLSHPCVNRLCTVVLTTKDRAGEPCVHGGERLFLQFRPLPLSDSSRVDVRPGFHDHQNGSYSITFKPRVIGQHQLEIAIRGQHIKGSPFIISVSGKMEYQHFGMDVQVFGSEGSEDGQFCRPWGVCCDQHGNIVVGDRSNNRIQVFEMSGVFKHKFGKKGVGPCQFNRPVGVAITREGHVIVADKDNHRVQVLKLDGTFLFMFGSKGNSDGQMVYPYDVAVNQSDGRIAVTDTGNHRLLIFSYDGILLGKFGYKGFLCGHFDSPRGITFNNEGHILVSDFNTHHVLVIHPDGTTARILGSQGGGDAHFKRPQGMAVDHMGNIVIADTRNNRIVIMHPSGQFVAKFGVAGLGTGQFDRPTSVAVLPDGHVAVMDFGNSRVQIV